MARVKKFESLRKILKFYKSHMFLYIIYVMILVIKAVISFFSAMFVSKMISSMMEFNFDLSIKYSIINLIILLIYCFLGIINTYFYKNLENNVKYDLQQEIIRSALNMKMSYYDELSSGKIVTRLTSDISHISERFKSITEKIVKIIRRFSYLVYIFILNYKVGIYVFISVFVISLVYSLRIYYLTKLKPKVKSKKEKVNSKIIETIRAIKDIKTLNCDENILSLIGNEQKEYIEKDNHEYYVGVFLSNLTDIITHLSDFFFIIVNVILISNNEITVSVFYTCYLYKDHTFNLANEIGDLRYKLAECEVSAKRLMSLVYPNKSNIDVYGNSYVRGYKGDIVFNNVNFSYKDGVSVLKNVSFNIKPKSTVAIVGASGSGKSTIANLIGHLYYKDSGEILFGNKDIDFLSKNFIRDNITIVNQFPYIFNLSIRDNFRIINSNISDKKIWKLCEEVQLKDYLETLPLGLDSIIGEGGCQLSGGQKQKLSIARALCRNVKVMIFDEATSSMDNLSQKEVMRVIKKLSKKLTIIIIAHRLSTITYADSIILVKNGKVIANDNHNNLFDNNKFYKSLFLKSS